MLWDVTDGDFEVTQDYKIFILSQSIKLNLIDTLGVLAQSQRAMMVTTAKLAVYEGRDPSQAGAGSDDSVDDQPSDPNDIESLSREPNPNNEGGLYW